MASNSVEKVNAVIMAAGLSSRFAPLSYERPKALLEVRGEVLIERQIRQLREAGIADITIVVGYQKESFYYLKEMFKGLTIIENTDYQRYNNTSTLMRVLDRLDNTYICSSDNFFVQNVFAEQRDEGAYYAAVYFPGAVNEWGIRTDSVGRITSIEHSPVNSWCMMGHAFFDRAFSVKFRSILQDEYAHKATRAELWEAVLERHLQELDMRIRKYPDGVIYEFDSLEDLRRFDSRYKTNSGSKIMRVICSQLACDESDIVDVKVISADSAQLEFAFNCRGIAYRYSRNSNSVARG